MWQRATVIQQKTGRPIQFEITETARESLAAWLELRGGSLEDYLFLSRLSRCPNIGTRQYARMVNEWVAVMGLQPGEHGTHSLRRRKASLIYKKTSKRCRSVWATPRSKAQSVILAWTSRMP